MKCIIVDDEFPSREELKYFINRFSNIVIEQEFDNGIDSLKFLSQNNIDVIFLDINMPILDGMEFSKILYKNNKDIRVVFITAYKEHALEAFEVHAFDYLLKPYSEERIISALKRLEKSKDEDEGIHNKRIEIEDINKKDMISDKISVIKDEKIYVIDTNEIYYIEAQGRGVDIYTKDRKYYSKIKISDIIKKLDKKEFYQTHRSYIVNLKKVEEIEPWFNGTYLLKMKDINKEITVSRSNIKKFREMLSLK
ncbi:MAG: LytTR family DNA-binding domain-containing protein [Clostridium sp.]|nr:LytTR family DNA-binding domain-containing protein [Clostridium sp.]